MMQVPPPDTWMGHTAYDVGLGIVAGALAVDKIISVLRAFNVIPEKQNGGQASAKNVGRLSIESFKSILRHQIVDATSATSAKLVANSDQQIILLTRMVTILEERKK